MVKTLRQKVASIALAGVVALGCMGTATTTALIGAASDVTIAHADSWKTSSGGWWYQTGSGYAKGWKQIGDAWYYFDSNGWMKTGWQSISGKWYYFNGSGAMVTGWKSLGGSWYYFNKSGAMVTGWQSIGGKWYYFDGSGAMLTGWQKSGGKWYYLDASGAMVAGKWVGNYYLNHDGTMATNTWIGDYHVDANGVWDQTRNSNSNSNNNSSSNNGNNSSNNNNSNNSNNSNNNSSNDNTSSTNTPSISIRGNWDCTAVTTTGSSGIKLVSPSVQYKNYIYFYSSGDVTQCVNGKYFYGTWSYFNEDDTSVNYSVTLDTGINLLALINKGSGTLLLAAIDNPNYCIFYER